MVKSYVFPTKIEDSFKRTMPPQARSIVHRIALDITHRVEREEQILSRIEIAHATLHMLLYQRFGNRSRDFAEFAHEALDDIVRNKLSASGELTTAYQV